jgi:PAS domain S-box-containing protein
VGVLTLLLVAGAWILTLKRELTRRRAAEAKLGEQYSTLRSIINDGDAIVFAVDRQFRYTAFNQAHAQVMKNLYDVTIELGCSMLDAMRVSADRDTARQNLEKALAGQKLVEEAYSGQDPSQRRYFRVSHSPIRTEGGAIIGVSALAQDLTLRKLAEEEVRDLNRELDRRVRERTAELNAANKELEAFAYSVSHDLRAPVRHIDGYIELLTRSLGATIDERSRGYLERVVDSTKRMGDLIDDLLSFSRMGRVELARLPVDLAKLTSDVIRACEPETRDRNIRWTIDALPAVVGDEAMLRIVLSNLVLNALKFSRPRAIATIEIGWKRDVTDETVIFVRDNGVGFDMKYVAKLFGVFQRLHRSEDFDGTGIGLANVQRIVRRHGGHAWAEGALDAGATFFFALPNTSHVPDRSSAVAAP